MRVSVLQLSGEVLVGCRCRMHGQLAIISVCSPRRSVAMVGMTSLSYIGHLTHKNNDIILIDNRINECREMNIICLSFFKLLMYRMTKVRRVIR